MGSEIDAEAYRAWQERGCPMNSDPKIDWNEAVKRVEARRIFTTNFDNVNKFADVPLTQRDKIVNSFAKQRFHRVPSLFKSCFAKHVLMKQFSTKYDKEIIVEFDCIKSIAHVKMFVITKKESFIMTINKKVSFNELDFVWDTLRKCN
jgi:hypothetical protein